MALDACCPEQALGDRAEHIPRRGPTMLDRELYRFMASDTSPITLTTRPKGKAFDIQIAERLAWAQPNNYLLTRVTSVACIQEYASYETKSHARINFRAHTGSGYR